MSPTATPRDPYELLGVQRDATEQQIKKAFRLLARELHPDVNAHDPQAEEKFKEAVEAYEILSDPERRATFDRYGHEGLRNGGYAPNFDAFGSISDLFDAFFGGGGPFGARPGPAQGADIAVTVEVDLIDVVTGKAVEVAFEVVERCEHCRGNRAEPGTPIETCPRCGGAGHREALTRTPFGQMVRAVACEACHGEGKIAKEPCKHCGGQGLKASRREVQIQVPAGIADGQRIRVSGRGHAGVSGVPSGDLYVLVKVRPDERFVREGDDLLTVVDLPAPLASLGATVQVPTLEGHTPAQIAAGTQPGEIITLRGHGMPGLRGGRRGDLRAVINVVIPRRLTDEQRELLERINTTLTEENLRSGESVFARLRRALRSQAA
jgi:molecular chaperone DnaJ